MPFTIAQQKFLTITPRVTASFSIIGSTYNIVQHVMRSKKRRKRVYTRILAVMSLMDLLWGIKAFLSSWILPSDFPMYGASGTVQTCTAAGFFGHIGTLTSVIYSGTLTMYFVMSISWNWTQERIEKQAEPWLHSIPLVIGVGTSIAALPLTLFNPIGWTCWIGPWPLNCEETGKCERGDNASLYRWILFYVYLLASFAFVVVAMPYIYCSIRRKEQRSEQYKFFNVTTAAATESSDENISSNNNNVMSSNQQKRQKSLLELHKEEKKLRISRRFVLQACLYVVAFLLTWVFPLTSYLTLIQEDGQLSWEIQCLSVFFSPLQGWWNATIYIRPRYIQQRERQRRRRRRRKQQDEKEEEEQQQQQIPIEGDNSPNNYTNKEDGSHGPSLYHSVQEAIFSAIAVDDGIDEDFYGEEEEEEEEDDDDDDDDDHDDAEEIGDEGDIRNKNGEQHDAHQKDSNEL